MSQFSLNVKHQQRYDTATNWSAKNPVLLVGEIGIESDTGKLKVGNGITAWNSLGYVGITTEYLQSNYLPKTNPIVSGAILMTDSNSKITRNTVSPAGNNIGVNGVMITHINGDEGGLLINEDGAYLWNSTDSGSLLKGLDEDVWYNNTGLKKDCDFSNGLVFNFDSSGNLKLKGKVYMDNGVTVPPKMWTGSETSYNALTSKDSTTLYIII